MCGAGDQAPDLIASLRAAEGMWVEWRRLEGTGLNRAQAARLPLYERTRQFRAYGCWVLPGLIQTGAYTRAVLRAAQQRRGLPDDLEAAGRPGLPASGYCGAVAALPPSSWRSPRCGTGSAARRS